MSAVTVHSASVVALAGAFGQLNVGPVVAVQPVAVVGPLPVLGTVVAGVSGGAVAGPVPMEVDPDEAMDTD